MENSNNKMNAIVNESSLQKVTLKTIIDSIIKTAKVHQK